MTVRVPTAGHRGNPVQLSRELRERQRHHLRHLLRVVADGAVHLLVRERLSRVVGRAVRLAAAAFGAGVGVEDLLPGEIRQFRDSELLAVFQIELRELTLRGRPLEENGRKPGREVEVLSEREEVEDGYDD